MKAVGKPIGVQDTPFLGVLGSTSELRIAQHFLGTRSIRFTQKQVADATGLARQTVAQVLEKLAGWQLLATERLGGRERLYYLNPRAPLTFALDTLAGAIVEEETGVEVLPRWEDPEEYQAWKANWLLESEFHSVSVAWPERPLAAGRVAAA